MKTFNVSYTRFNEREATQGGTDRYGFVDQDLTLREALQTVLHETPAMSETRGTYADSSEPRLARSVSAEMNCWEDGDDLTLTIHFPHNTTPSSAARLVRLIQGKL
jgi:hypothetical protein